MKRLLMSFKRNVQTRRNIFATLFISTWTVILIIACPAKMTVYDHMRNILSYQDIAVVTADSFVGHWVNKQTDKDKIAKVKERYAAIKKTVLDGLAALAAGVTVAEEAGKPVDQKKLRADITKLVKTLLDFGLSLESAVNPAAPATQPNNVYLRMRHQRNKVLAHINGTCISKHGCREHRFAL